MMRFCRIVIITFAALYLAALALFFVGTYGMFGVERDPLSGVFLIPLGLPWNRLVDAAAEPLWPWLAAAAPAINLALLALVCRALGRGRT